MENVNFAQLLTFPIAGARMGNLLSKFVKAGVDLSLPLTLPCIRLLPSVPDQQPTINFYSKTNVFWGKSKNVSDFREKIILPEENTCGENQFKLSVIV